MTYDDAEKYCNEHSGSSVFYLDTFDDLSPLGALLHFSGNIVYAGYYQKHVLIYMKSNQIYSVFLDHILSTKLRI